MAIPTATAKSIDWRDAACTAAHDRDERNAREHEEWVQRKREESRKLILEVLDLKCGVTVDAPNFLPYPDDELRDYLNLDGVRLIAHSTDIGGMRHLHIITEPCPRCGFIKLSNEIYSLADLGDALLNPPTLDGHRAYDAEKDQSFPCIE